MAQLFITTILGFALLVMGLDQVAPSFLSQIYAKKIDSGIAREENLMQQIIRHRDVTGSYPSNMAALIAAGYWKSADNDNGFGAGYEFSVDSSKGQILVSTTISDSIQRAQYISNYQHVFKPVDAGGGLVTTTFVMPTSGSIGTPIAMTSSIPSSATAPDAASNTWWYDTSGTTAVLKVSNGVSWANADSSGAVSPTPANVVTGVAGLPATANSGDIRYVLNTVTGTVTPYIYFGGQWVPYGTVTPTYLVAASGGVTSINEGNSLTFNVTTTNITAATTLYWSVNGITAAASDFSAVSGSVAISSNAGSFSMSFIGDGTTEGPETFTVSIRTTSVSGAVVATSNTLTINDTSLTPLNCTAQSRTWGSCSGNLAAALHGGSATASNTISNYSGSATYSCSNGAWSLGANSCTGTASCSARSQSWSSCSGSVSGAAHGGSATASNVNGSYSGSATYSCNNGSWTLGSQSCTALASCSTQSQSWSSCSGTVPGVAHGSSSTAGNTNSNYSGSATYSCNNGSWSLGSQSCAALAGCSSQSRSWGSCSGTLSSVGHGSSSTAGNTAANYSGSATYSCSNGAWSLGANSCTGTASCSAQSQSWGSCSGTVPAASHGGSSTAGNVNGSYSGSATYSCNNGSWSLGNQSCTYTPPANCSAQWGYWGSCSGVISGTSHGSWSSAGNSAANYSGSASYYCNNGSWSLGGQSCTYSPPPAGCSQTPVSWGGGCSGLLSAISHGGSASARSSEPGYSGSASYSCNNGAINLMSQSCSPVYTTCTQEFTKYCNGSERIIDGCPTGLNYLPSTQTTTHSALPPVRCTAGDPGNNYVGDRYFHTAQICAAGSPGCVTYTNASK